MQNFPYLCCREHAGKRPALCQPKHSMTMKKALICLIASLCCTLAAQAQFEKNKWFINTSATGLGFSYSGSEKARFGFEAVGGAFVADNFSLLLDFGGEYGKGISDMTHVGVKTRYYFEKVGIFLGGGLKYKHFGTNAAFPNDAAAAFEAGYAFFVSRTVTFEPALFYDQSLVHHRDLSRVGFKVGFGFYF